MQKFTSIADYLAAQSNDKRVSVDALREMVLDTHPRLVEIIKWNSPSYTLDGMDRLTINSSGQGAVRLIMHLGASHAEDKAASTSFDGDPDGLLTWHSDIRASFAMPPVAKLSESRDALVEIVRAWLAFGGD